MKINSKLTEIVNHKKIEVAHQKNFQSLSELQKNCLIKKSEKRSLLSRIDPASPFLIAEFKRESPAKGPLNLNADLVQIVKGYESSGASCLSVLTDQQFFKGSPEDLIKARKSSSLPILRKDFIIDSYQVYESCAWGADLILLIAAILTPQEVESLARLAKDLGMEVILEIHDSTELNDLDLNDIDFLGVNNRNLNSFKTDYRHSINIASQLPQGIVKISESGINSPEVAAELFKCSYQGFLIGEYFMTSSSPEEASNKFLTDLKSLSTKN